VNVLPTKANWLWLVLVVAVVAYLHVFVFHKLTTADDVFFSAALDHQSLYEYLRFRYHHWTGRLPIEAALVLVINRMWLWRMLNCLMLLLLCYGVGKSAFARSQGLPGAVACTFVLLILVTPRVLWEGGWWVTGSFNYLWPAALGAYGALPFMDRSPRGALRYSSHLVAAGLAAYNEQVGLVLICLLPWLLIAAKSRRTEFLWKIAIVVFVALNWTIAVTAPGVHHRFVLEHRWFANFDALAWHEKANLGLGLVKQGILDPGNLLVVLLAATTVPPLLASTASRFAKATILLGLTYIGCGFLVVHIAPTSRWASAYLVSSISGQNAAYPKAYLAMAVSQFAIACLATAVALAFRQSPRKMLFIAWALLVALASIAVLGWSPTVYASGSRVFFVAEMILLAVTCHVIAATREVHGGRAFAAVMTLAAMAASLRLWNLAT
jgi:hypothetical protein